MPQLFAKAFVSTLPFIIPLVLVMILVYLWATRTAKRKQQQALDAMKQQVAAEVVDQLKRTDKTEPPRD